jgi:mono/diheme cytochrome c family protein
MSILAKLCSGLIGSIVAFSLPTGPASADNARGLALTRGWCAECHAVTKDNRSPNPNAPSFSDLAAQGSTTELSLRAFLRTPHPTMPDIIIKPADADDIIGYILSLQR